MSGQDAPSARRGGRARRAPSKLEVGGDNDRALAQALKKSMLETKRVEADLLDAPVFHPTLEQLNCDPLAYFASLAEEGHRCGIVRVVTPPEWRPRFELDMSKPFTTKRQLLHSLGEGVAFDEGYQYTQAQYRTVAGHFQSEWQARHPDLAAQLGACADEPAAAAALLEREYWRIVERVSSEEIAVDYASDINTRDYASAFGDSSSPTSPGAAAGKTTRRWDLSALPAMRKCLLSEVGSKIDGLTQPWLYFGMLFATFCWHTEDHFLYSINYHHTGADKTWYGIPSSAASKFEEALRAAVPGRFEEDRDLLHQIVTMLPPGLLLGQGLPVRRTLQRPGDIVLTFPRAYHAGFSHGWCALPLQRPGDIVLTFPRAYHAGFSHGWNCAEATNFALSDWLPFGRLAADKYSRGSTMRHSVFSHDMLLWDWARLLARPVQATVEKLPPLQQLRAAAQQQQLGRGKEEAPAPAARVSVSLQLAEEAAGPAVRLQLVPEEAAAPSVSVAEQQQQLQERQTSHAAASAAAAAKQQVDSFAAWHSYRRSVLRLRSSEARFAVRTAVPDAAAAAEHLASLGARPADVALVHRELVGRVQDELAARDGMRGHGARFRVAQGGLRVSASDDRISCCVCGGLPYLSYTRCGCLGGAPRCMQHAVPVGCACPGPRYEVMTEPSEAEMAELAFCLWALLPDALRAQEGGAEAASPPPLHDKRDGGGGSSRSVKRRDDRRGGGGGKRARVEGEQTGQPPLAPLAPVLLPQAVAVVAEADDQKQQQGVTPDAAAALPLPIKSSGSPPAVQATGADAKQVQGPPSPPVMVAGKSPARKRGRPPGSRTGGNGGSCTACGRSVKAGSVLKCIACDCLYHTSCVPTDVRRASTGGDLWLCEFCVAAQ